MPVTPAILPDTIPRCQRCAARPSCLIGRLPRPHQERLDPTIREVGFRKGEALQSEGVAPAVVRSIKLGTVMLTRGGEDGKHRPVAMVGRGHLLGTWGSLDKPTQVGALALSTGRVCELPLTALRHSTHRDPVMLDALHHQLQQAFARLADWSQVMRLRGLKHQLLAALNLLALEQGTRTVHLPSQVALASLLSSSRESVARMLRQLEDEGLLRRVDRWRGELTPTAPETEPNDQG